MGECRYSFTFLDFDTRCRCGHLHALAALSPRKKPRTYWIGGCGGETNFAPPGRSFSVLTHGAVILLRGCQLCSYSELLSVLRNPKSHYRVHNSPPLVPIASQINSIHTIPFSLSLSKTHFNIVHSHLGLPSGLFTSGFLTNIPCAFHFSPFVLHALSISFSLT
jgi:hypothetical protein